MGKYLVQVWLYCLVTRANGDSHWRKMQLLESRVKHTERYAHECGELLTDVHSYRDVAGSRAVMYEII